MKARTANKRTNRDRGPLRNHTPPTTPVAGRKGVGLAVYIVFSYLVTCDHDPEDPVRN